MLPQVSLDDLAAEPLADYHGGRIKEL